MSRILLLLTLSFLIACSCVHTPVATPTGATVPVGYVLIKKDVLADVMEKCATTKSQLQDCLGKLPIK